VRRADRQGRGTGWPENGREKPRKKKNGAYYPLGKGGDVWGKKETKKKTSKMFRRVGCVGAEKGLWEFKERVVSRGGGQPSRRTARIRKESSGGVNEGRSSQKRRD